MKKVVEVIHFDTESMEQHGFTTDAQKKAVSCVGDLMADIQAAKGSFGMLTFFISEADMLGDRPVTIWSNLDDGAQLRMFEDYILKRMRLRQATKHTTEGT